MDQQAQAPGRTWSAKIEIAGNLILGAPTSKYDLLLDQRDAAARFVREMVVLPGKAWEVYVILYKTTKKHGTRRDRSFRVTADRIEYVGA